MKMYSFANGKTQICVFFETRKYVFSLKPFLNYKVFFRKLKLVPMPHVRQIAICICTSNRPFHTYMYTVKPLF